MGIFSRLLGDPDNTKRGTRKSPREIIADFGEALEDCPPFGVVADIEELPHPKEQIRKAILVFLVSIDDQSLKEHLCEAYYSLASWQQGVGKKRIGIDLSSMPRNGTKEEVLKTANSLLKDYEEWKKWESIVTKEQDKLLNDLQKLGF